MCCAHTDRAGHSPWSWADSASCCCLYFWARASAFRTFCCKWLYMKTPEPKHATVTRQKPVCRSPFCLLEHIPVPMMGAEAKRCSALPLRALLKHRILPPTTTQQPLSSANSQIPLRDAIKVSPPLLSSPQRSRRSSGNVLFLVAHRREAQRDPRVPEEKPRDRQLHPAAPGDRPGTRGSIRVAWAEGNRRRGETRKTTRRRRRRRKTFASHVLQWRAGGAGGGKGYGRLWLFPPPSLEHRPEKISRRDEKPFFSLLRFPPPAIRRSPKRKRRSRSRETGQETGGGIQAAAAASPPSAAGGGNRSPGGTGAAVRGDFSQGKPLPPLPKPKPDTGREPGDSRSLPASPRGWLV